MNPSDILYINPSINVGGVILSNKQSQDTIGNLSILFPSNIGVTANDSTLGALIKTANSSGSGSSGASVAGSFIALGYDNKLVAQVIQDVSFYTGLTTYTGGLCRHFGTTVTNIFDHDTINSSQVFQFQTNYLLKHVGATITMYFINTDSTTTSDSHTLTNSSNIGTYGTLSIIRDGDPFLNNLPYANIFTACKYKNTPRIFDVSTTYNTDSVLIPYIYILQEQLTSTSPIYNSYAKAFYIDTSPTPSLSSNISNFNGAILTSGLYVLPLNSSIDFSFTVNNITSEFYNSKTININSNFSSETFITPTYDMIISCYTTGTYTFTYNLNITNNISGIETLTLIVNSLTKNSSYNLSCLIDTTNTLESDIRVTSGTGRFTDVSQFNSFDSSVPLTNNEELLYIFGNISYPCTDYSICIPQGIDYSNLTGSYNTYRWFTQKISQSNIPTYITSGYIKLNNITYITSPLLLNQLIIDIYMNGNIYITTSPFYETTNTIISDNFNNKLVNNSYFIYFNFKTQIQVNTDLYIRLGIPDSTKQKIIFNSLTLSVN